jgi:hypothetical protein
MAELFTAFGTKVKLLYHIISMGIKRHSIRAGDVRGCCGQENLHPLPEMSA